MTKKESKKLIAYLLMLNRVPSKIEYETTENKIEFATIRGYLIGCLVNNELLETDKYEKEIINKYDRFTDHSFEDDFMDAYKKGGYKK